ncbi:Uncharacterised protein [Aggregatibacter aphrophilus]|nr:Uncharacterised protein [Aggregatibacter aphrophilus]
MWFAILSIAFYLFSVLLIAPILLNAQVGDGQTKPKKNTFFSDRTLRHYFPCHEYVSFIAGFGC